MCILNTIPQKTTYTFHWMPCYSLHNTKIVCMHSLIHISNTNSKLIVAIKAKFKWIFCSVACLASFNTEYDVADLLHSTTLSVFIFSCGINVMYRAFFDSFNIKFCSKYSFFAAYFGIIQFYIKKMFLHVIAVIL